jgi:hypothetical protein
MHAAAEMMWLQAMLFVTEEVMEVETEATTVGLTARAAGRMSLFLVAAYELKLGAGRPAGGQINKARRANPLQR